jgi:hypothetical protein
MESPATFRILFILSLIYIISGMFKKDPLSLLTFERSEKIIENIMKPYAKVINMRLSSFLNIYKKCSQDLGPHQWYNG